MTPQKHPLLLACSPRSGGNSDAAITAVHQTLYGADSSAPSQTDDKPRKAGFCKGTPAPAFTGGNESRLRLRGGPLTKRTLSTASAGAEESAPSAVFLRDHPVLPCISCGHCARSKLACPLAARDASAPLFDALQTAPALVLAAPVYFYHVPAQLKALIDRSQPWWMLRDVWNETPFPRRTAHVILVAARPQGQKLFEGSLLSLRYWLDLFGYDFAEPLTLCGLEGPDALRDNAEQYARLARYAETIRAALPRARE